LPNHDDPGAELGTIAHDLSNLLAAIRSFAIVIGEDAPDDEMVRRDVDQILTAVDQAAMLARRLRELRVALAMQ